MNKGQLIETVAKNAKLSKKEATEAVKTVLETILKGVKKDPVGLVGFGTFRVTKMKARNGVNPATGEKIRISARKVLKFKASKTLKF